MALIRSMEVKQAYYSEEGHVYEIKFKYRNKYGDIKEVDFGMEEHYRGIDKRLGKLMSDLFKGKLDKMLLGFGKKR